MDKGKPKVQLILESVFNEAIEKLTKQERGQFVGALLVQVDISTGEVHVYDDSENLLEKNIIFEWVEQPEKSTRFYRQALHYMRVVLAALRLRKAFDNPVFLRPLRVIVVDDMFNEIETVFTLEGSDVWVEGRLMKNLEQELQNFSLKIFGNIE